MRVSVLERGRLIRHEDPQIPGDDQPLKRYIPAPLFDALQRAEQAREAAAAARALRTGKPKGDAIFTWTRPRGRQVAIVGPWVGVIEVGGLQLELLPKVDRDDQPPRLPSEQLVPMMRGNLLSMLERAGQIPVRLRGPARTAMRRGSLKDGLVRQFLAQLVRELLRGEPRAYVTAEERLGTVRGRLMLRDQLLRSAGLQHRFWCRFDELVGDPRIGARLKAACAVLSRLGLDPESRRLLHQARALLDEAPDLDPAASDDVHFDRQNDRFRAVYRFAGHIIAGESPDLRAGKSASFALLYNMDRLFEGFIAELMEREVLVGPDRPAALHGWKVKPQGRDRNEPRRYLLSASHAKAQRGVLELKPDLLFVRGKDYFIIDTKWKHMGVGEAPGRTDLYQLYGYLEAYKCGRVTLLYPGAELEPGLDLTVNHAPDFKICARFVDLSRDLDQPEDRAQLIQRLRELLVEIVAAGSAEPSA